MICLTTLFPTPIPSWVLYPEDEEQVNTRVHHVLNKHPNQTLSNGIGYHDWTALWKSIQKTPTGLGMGPSNWRPRTKTPSLRTIIDPLFDWAARINTYTQWLTQEREHNTLGLFINETSLLSFVSPTIPYTQRAAILNSKPGFWWACLTLRPTPTLSTPTFLPLSDETAIETALNDGHLSMCLTTAEERVLKKFGHGTLDPRIKSLITAPQDTAWYQSRTMVPAVKTPQDSPSAYGMETLATLILNHSKRALHDTP